MTRSYTLFSHNPEEFLGESFYDWRKYVFQETADYLCSQGFDVKQAERESFEIILGPDKIKQVVIRDSLAFIQDDQSGDYYVLDCHDIAKADDLEFIVRDSRCKRILKCQYPPSVFKDAIYQKVKPWTYFDRFWPKNERQLVASRKITRTSNSLYFRGADWAKRGRILNELSKRGLIPPDYEITGFDEYFRESCQHRVILSLPGMADLCNRDVESFGSGTCVLRPKLRNEFHNELIPDYHYISVDTKYHKIDPIEVADKIEQRFREIADDHEFIDFVVKNAARWYDENVRIGPAMKLTAKLLDLD